MCLLRMARVEQRSEAKKKVANLLTVKSSQIVQLEKTGVRVFIREVLGVYRMCISYMATARLDRRVNGKYFNPHCALKQERF